MKNISSAIRNNAVSEWTGKIYLFKKEVSQNQWQKFEGCNGKWNIG